jgi:hypothetical protein
VTLLLPWVWKTREVGDWLEAYRKCSHLALGNVTRDTTENLPK